MSVSRSLRASKCCSARRVAAAHEGGGAPSSEGSDVRRATDPGRRARPADCERKRRAPGGAGDAGARASTRVARKPWWRGKASPACCQRCRTVCVHFQVVGSRARGSAACGRGWQKRDECAVSYFRIIINRKFGAFDSLPFPNGNETFVAIVAIGVCENLSGKSLGS